MMTKHYTFYAGNDDIEIIDGEDNATTRYARLLNQLFLDLDKSRHQEDTASSTDTFLRLLKGNKDTKQIYNLNPTLIESMRLIKDKNDIKAFTVGIPMPTGMYLSYAYQEQ